MSPASTFRVSLDTALDVRSWVNTSGAKSDLVGEKAAVSMEDWVYLTPEPRVGILKFDRFPFQAPTSESTSGPGLPGLYSEEVAEAESVVIRKSTQVGVSAYCWRWGARQADQFADRVLYIFPTDRHVTEFGRERIDTSIAESEYLSRRSPPGVINNQHQKRIGDGWLYLRGATQTRAQQRSAGAQSVAAQSIIFDEYDDLDQRTVSQMERRISGATQTGTKARIRRVGVPTIDGYGIAAAYVRSDQRHWQVTCTECGTEQKVEFANVRWTTTVRPDRADPCRPGDDAFDDDEDVIDAWRCCCSCEADLDVINGRWMADNSGARVIGFHVPRLIVPDVDIRSIIRSSRKTTSFEIEAFFQNDLGIPYSSDESGLSLELVTELVTRGGDMLEKSAEILPVTMGVDTANQRRLHVRITEHRDTGERYPLFVGEVDTFGDVARLIEQYNVWVCAIDSMPERRKARDVAAAYPGRVVLAQYNQRADAAPFHYDPITNVVSVNRTEAIDAMLDNVRTGKQKLPRRPPKFYVDHLIALKRRLVRDNANRPSYTYITAGTHGDDFAHAEVYDLVAREVMLLKGADDNYAGEQVMSGGIETVHLEGGEIDHYEPGFGGGL